MINTETIHLPEVIADTRQTGEMTFTLLLAAHVHLRHSDVDLVTGEMTEGGMIGEIETGIAGMTITRVVEEGEEEGMVADLVSGLGRDVTTGDQTIHTTALT